MTTASAAVPARHAYVTNARMTPGIARPQARALSRGRHVDLLRPVKVRGRHARAGAHALWRPKDFAVDLDFPEVATH